jgi:hypothetical protein
MAGFDTADPISSQVPVAITTWGKPNFWIRYFAPCSYTPLSTNARAECDALWDGNSTAPYLGSMSTPTQSRLSGSSAEGLADAQTYISSMLSAYDTVAPLFLPTNRELWCWLDQEPGTTLSLDYWNGWAGYLNGYELDGFGYPFYAGLHCDPAAPALNCSIVDGPSAAACFAVWASGPLRCSNSLASPPPAWTPGTCGSVVTQLWQYWVEDTCRSTAANVDISFARPGTYYPSYCFWLASRP